MSQWAARYVDKNDKLITIEEWAAMPRQIDYRTVRQEPMDLGGRAVDLRVVWCGDHLPGCDVEPWGVILTDLSGEYLHELGQFSTRRDAVAGFLAVRRLVSLSQVAAVPTPGERLL